LCVSDGSGFAASVPTAAIILTAAARQIGSTVQVPSDSHKSTFFQPEEMAPWLERCKNTDHKAVVVHKYLLAFVFAGLALQKNCLLMCQLSVQNSTFFIEKFIKGKRVVD
jgi:hypothetical protein